MFYIMLTKITLFSCIMGIFLDDLDDISACVPCDFVLISTKLLKCPVKHPLQRY